MEKKTTINVTQRDGEVKASDCKCNVCGKPAVAFWPVVDPDIPSYPYCRKCLDKAKMELMTKLYGLNGKVYKSKKKFLEELKEL